MLRVAICVVGSLIAGAASAQLVSNNGKYDGTVTITQVAGPTCGNFASVRDSYPAVLRPRVQGSTSPESISAVIPRGALLLVAQGDGTLPGTNQQGQGSFIFDGTGGQSPAPATLNITYTPAVTTGSPVFISVSGQVQNFGVPGCRVTFKGGFVRRP